HRTCGPRGTPLRATAASRRGEAFDREGSERLRFDVGPRARTRCRSGRAGRPRTTRGRQSHGRNSGSSPAAPRPYGGRGRRSALAPGRGAWNTLMRKTSRITLRSADASNARKLHALIAANLEEGHLLPRELDELTVHAERFVIAVRGRTIVGCAELAPLGPHIAEVRS